MRFGILGPIELHIDGSRVPLGGLKQRALLAFLLLHANEVASRDRLIHALWGESPPPSASDALDTYVYRLRKLIGYGRLARHGGGYLLSVEAGSSMPAGSSCLSRVLVKRPVLVTAAGLRGC